ncbi:FAD-dependent oxidoreductase [Nakamurella leprariae]|uniref:FAD-dependent oxidoreductase n=1 Tax=Nakamurella leprariae TaxID=2803911 RepID=A0A939BXY1_9ACTN|nr:FAD-dependent oxidoreductase [Nakamurella leprariae]MBM9466480.1 FAD-dependent oxidoreductase [Nakamurella leprariae]
MEQFDLLVVGGGTAGLPAAAEATRLGLRVLLVEQSDRLGGTLWRSWAQMSAAGTDLQRQHGIVDDPQSHFDDVMRICRDTADPVLVRLAVEHAAETIDGLMAAGFDMDPASPAILHFHEAYRVARTYWGRQGGRSVLEVLLPQTEAAQRRSLSVRMHTRLTGLLRSDAGSIEAVELHDGSGATSTVAVGAVLLASGGFAGNPDLFRRLVPGKRLVGPGSPDSTGSGIELAMGLGARIRGADKFLPTYGGVLEDGSDHVSVPLDDYPSLTPQTRRPWEIHVNARGERYVAEDGDSVDDREHALLVQPGQEFWIVSDARVAREAPPLFPTWSAEALAQAYDAHPSFVRAGSLDELAERTGMDPVTLRATVEQYNRAAAGEVPDVFGRRHFPLPLQEPPFLAVRNHGTVLKTPTGVQVDGTLRVLDVAGPVANLFAAGEVLGGSALSGRSFVSGMSVTPALTFGRLVARTVAGQHDQTIAPAGTAGPTVAGRR